MIKKSIQIAFITSTLILTGCASGLNSMQEREYSAWKQEGVLVEEKDPTTGAVLGLLPGGGSFYARKPALGIVNLLFWPLSIFWDPISGSDGSKSINYDLTQHKLKKDKSKELSELDNRLTLDEISKAQYIAEKRKIEEKYNF